MKSTSAIYCLSILYKIAPVRKQVGGKWSVVCTESHPEGDIVIIVLPNADRLT